MAEHEIQILMQTAMSSLREMVDVNTIIGDIIETAGGTSIIPVSRVSCGFIAGGGEYGKEKASGLPFGGGSGAGISLLPVAFLVVTDEQVRLIPVMGATSFDKAIEAVPIIADQLQNLFQKEPKDSKNDDK